MICDGVSFLRVSLSIPKTTAFIAPWTQKNKHKNSYTCSLYWFNCRLLRTPSPNNIHAFKISEPSILLVFCMAIQAVGYIPLIHFYIQLIHLLLLYLYIHFNEYRQDIVKKFLFNPTQPPPSFVISNPPPPSLAPSCEKLWICGC